jgi:hypothetical protein
MCSNTISGPIAIRLEEIVPRSMPGMTIRSSRQMSAAEAGNPRGSQSLGDEANPRIAAVIEVQVGHGMDTGFQVPDPNATRARGLDDEGGLAAGKEVVATAEAARGQLGSGEAGRIPRVPEAQQVDGQETLGARLFLPRQFPIAAVGDRHGHPRLVDAQPGAHPGEGPVRAVVGPGQQAAQRFRSDPVADRRGHRPAPRLLAIGPDHHRGTAFDPEADEDQAHGMIARR